MPSRGLDGVAGRDEHHGVAQADDDASRRPAWPACPVSMERVLLTDLNLTLVHWNLDAGVTFPGLVEPSRTGARRRPAPSAGRCAEPLESTCRPRALPSGGSERGLTCGCRGA